MSFCNPWLIYSFSFDFIISYLVFPCIKDHIISISPTKPRKEKDRGFRPSARWIGVYGDKKIKDKKKIKYRETIKYLTIRIRQRIKYKIIKRLPKRRAIS